MKALICNDYGPIDNLVYGDIDEPVPGSHEVVILSEAMGVNYPDGLLVQGLYQSKPPTPFVPGMEVVGTVVEIGDQVSGIKVGDRVACVSSLGAFAEKVKSHKSTIMPIPADVDAAEVTALMCGYGTSHHALKQRADLQAGETLVVTGAAGLTGLAAVQLGKVMGARVIAVASTEEKRSIALENGADEALGYDDLKEAIKKATDGNGADVVFDVVGGEVFDACSRAMAWKGRLLVIGFASGTIPKFPINLALVKGYSLVGVFWGSFCRKEPEAYADNMKELMGWYASGKIKPYVEKTFALSDGVAAINHIHARKAVGKIALTP